MLLCIAPWIKWVIIGGVALVVIVIVGACIALFNKLVVLNNNCDEAWSTIDVYLKKRYDLIPNLVETVKGYASHEEETLTKVISARNQAVNATNVNDKIIAENSLSSCLRSLFAVAEAYPNLKADAQFLDLQRQLQNMETELSQARKYYNGVCKAFNITIQKFPNNIFVYFTKYRKRNYFEIENEEERQNVKVDFSRN